MIGTLCLLLAYWAIRGAFYLPGLREAKLPPGIQVEFPIASWYSDQVQDRHRCRSLATST